MSTIHDVTAKHPTRTIKRASPNRMDLLTHNGRADMAYKCISRRILWCYTYVGKGGSEFELERVGASSFGEKITKFHVEKRIVFRE